MGVKEIISHRSARVNAENPSRSHTRRRHRTGRRRRCCSHAAGQVHRAAVSIDCKDRSVEYPCLSGEYRCRMVMKLLRCNLVTQLEPDTVEEINFLGRQVRRMRSQIKHMFLPVWEINLKDQLRFGGG